MDTGEAQPSQAPYRVKLRIHFGGTFTKNPECPGEWRYTDGEKYLDTVLSDVSYAQLIRKWNLKLGEAVLLKYLAPGEDLDPNALVHVMDNEDLQELYSEYADALTRPGVSQATFRIQVFASRALVFEMDCEDPERDLLYGEAALSEMEQDFNGYDSSDPSADTGWGGAVQPSHSAWEPGAPGQPPHSLPAPAVPWTATCRDGPPTWGQPVPAPEPTVDMTLHALTNISKSVQLAWGLPMLAPGYIPPGEEDPYQLDDPYHDDDKPLLRVSERSEDEQQRVQRQLSEHQLRDHNSAGEQHDAGGQQLQPKPGLGMRKPSQSRLQHLFHDSENTNNRPSAEIAGPPLQNKPLGRVRDGGARLPSRISAFGDSSDGRADGGRGGQLGTLHLPSHISAFGEDNMPVSINGAQAWEAERQHMQQLYGNKPQPPQLVTNQGNDDLDAGYPGPSLVTQEFRRGGSTEVGTGAMADLQLQLAPLPPIQVAHQGADERDNGASITPKPLLDSVPHVPRVQVGAMTKIGEGAFGEVSSAQVFPYGTVAIKWLKRERFAKYSESFQREAEVLARLNHPNIIRMFGLVTEPSILPPASSSLNKSLSGGSGQGNAAAAEAVRRSSGNISGLHGGQIIAGIMMEYLKGGSLAQHFRALAQAGRKLSLRERVRVALQASLGMSYLHDQSPAVIHFDLKPDNLLLAGEGQDLLVKVADFGLSKHKFQSYVTCHDLRGTLPYMAPELVANPSQVCEKCDVYSMGVVCWEMMSLEVPFQELTAQEILMGLMHGNLQLYIPATCETEWQGLISACMEQNPRNRPSFRMLAVRLEELGRRLEAQQAQQDEAAQQHAAQQALLVQQQLMQQQALVAQQRAAAAEYLPHHLPHDLLSSDLLQQAGCSHSLPRSQPELALHAAALFQLQPQHAPLGMQHLGMQPQHTPIGLGLLQQQLLQQQQQQQQQQQHKEQQQHNPLGLGLLQQQILQQQREDQQHAVQQAMHTPQRGGGEGDWGPLGLHLGHLGDSSHPHLNHMESSHPHLNLLDSSHPHLTHFDSSHPHLGVLDSSHALLGLSRPMGATMGPDLLLPSPPHAANVALLAQAYGAELQAAGRYSVPSTPTLGFDPARFDPMIGFESAAHAQHAIAQQFQAAQLPTGTLHAAAWLAATCSGNMNDAALYCGY